MYRSIAGMLVAATALALSGCGHASPTSGPLSAQRASAATSAASSGTDPQGAGAGWLQGNAKADLELLRGDVASVTKDWKSRDATALFDDCLFLYSDARVAGNLPAIPQAEAERHWVAALADLSRGVRDCSLGHKDARTAETEQGVSELLAAGPELAAVSRMLTPAPTSTSMQ